MAEQFQCRSGHQWSAEVGGADQTVSVSCPVCGADGATAGARTAGARTAGAPTTNEAARGDEPSLPDVPGYDLLRVIGRGGMGVVYHARHHALGREVALKVILTAEHAQPDELARFRAEAETVARLQHPNIVPIYELGEMRGRPYFTMELVAGGTLKRRLARGPLSDHEAATLLLKLAVAAGYAHTQGIVHRDLKPENVLLTESGEPKITDFGVAKRLAGGTGLTATGAVLGTPAYMAPEQAAGKKDVGPAADVYSLGAILYECLTGRAPFVSDSMYDTLHRVLTEDPVSPAWFRSEISRDLETICLKCLRKEPDKRYGGAGDLAEDLRRFLAGAPVRARPIGAVERAVRWARRKPALATAYGLLAAALVLGGGGAVWYKIDRDALNAKAEKEKEAAEHQKQLTEQAVRADLSEAALLRRQGAWAEAKAAVERAQGRLGAGGAPDVAKAVEQASADLKIVARLDEVQVAEAGSFNLRKAEEGYAAAFRDYGLPLDELQPEEAADRIKASAVREQLIAALDDWIYIQAGHAAPGQAVPVELTRLRTCVTRADDDKLRQQFRDLAERKDPDARMELEQLAGGPDVLHEPGLILVILGMTLSDRNNPTAEEGLLRRARVVYPNDFWVTYRLAQILSKKGGPKDEALGCYWTVLALRPQNLGLYCEVYSLLMTMGRTREAADVAHKAVQLPGDSAEDYFNLASVLGDQGEIEEAAAEFQKAIDLRHGDFGDAHWNIALLFQDLGRREEARKEFDQAAEAYRRACDQDPSDPRAPCDLGQALLHEGRFTEAVQNLQRGSELAAQRKEEETSCRWLQDARGLADMDAKIPAALQGKAESADAAALLAEIAQMPHRRLYAASARLYAQAFLDDPRLMEGLDGSRRFTVYSAACAAALAAAGQGDDAGGLGQEERDRLRKLAVTWLRHDLDAWADQVDGGIDSTLQAAIHRTLKIWKVNADLAGLRDDAALAGSPQAVREACRKLWADVNALLDRTGPSQ